MIFIEIPYGTLPDVLTIGNCFYDTKKVLTVIENIEGRTILTKDQTRTLKRFYNVTFQLKANKSFNGLYIYGRNGDIHFIKEEL